MQAVFGRTLPLLLTSLLATLAPPVEAAPVTVTVTVQNHAEVRTAEAVLAYDRDGATLTTAPVTASLAVDGSEVKGFTALMRIPDSYSLQEPVLLEGFENPQYFIHNRTVVWGGDLPAGGSGKVSFDAEAP